MSKTPTTLIIMDGFGVWDERAGNAIAAARTPNLDKIFAENPGCRLSASGLDVGLPEGQMGNSEVGHTNIGAGRVVFQDLPRISRAIEDGSFFENEAYIEAMDDCKERDGALHLMGLLSDGGVHSHITHLFALLEMAKKRGLGRVYVHCFLDGRDVPPASGKGYVEKLVEKCKEVGVGQVATVMGRYYAMDRDKRWDRVQRAYDAMTRGEGVQNPDPVDAVQRSYDAGVTDEFVEPVVCTKDGKVKEGDSIIFINFRPDRAREITRCFVDPAFTDVERKIYFAEDMELSPIACAYVRARGADRLCSYGDWAALSDVCDADTARYLALEVSDGVIAPGYTDEALAILKTKRKGGYNVVQIDPDYAPKAVEHKDVFGITFEQGRNSFAISEALLDNIVTDNKELPESAKRDMLIALITLKYTQSNSVCYVKDGQAIGVGAGNGPAYIHHTADVRLAVKRILDSKTFDNGTICASEQSIVVERRMEGAVTAELKAQGAYLLDDEEHRLLSKFILRPNGTMNPAIVGKSVETVAKLAGLTRVPPTARVLVARETGVGPGYPYSNEKLGLILAYYVEDSEEAVLRRCVEILEWEGAGHTFAIHTEDADTAKRFAAAVPASRVLVNTPAALGGIGATTCLFPALTLGCGAVGGSSSSNNIGPLDLINIKRVAWGVKELEELRGNRPAAGYAPCAVDESLLNELVNRIIGRLSV